MSEPDYKKLYEDEKKKTSLLERLLALYEQNGSAKLYYSLNRKSNEMADLLNKTALSSLDLSNKDDKTFERMKVLWSESASISTAVKELGILAKVTGSEEEDVNKKPFNDRIAEDRE